MARSSRKSTANILRLSGLLFAAAATFHILRYFMGWDFRVGGFELTEAGSLILGTLVGVLSVLCFVESYK